MSYDDTIENIKKEVEQKQKELEELQITANQLCKLAKRPLLYETVGYKKSDVVQEKNLKGDEYYGQPLARVITQILEDRKKDGLGPATIDDIYGRMVEGGYIFVNKKEPKREIGISMGKNQKFTKLPNEKWGLTEWYPNVKEKKVANGVVIGPEDKQPQQEAETPVIVKEVETSPVGKKRGRPKKVVQPETKKEEPKE